MKTKIFLLCAFVVFAFTVTSCKNDGNEPVYKPPQDEYTDGTDILMLIVDYTTNEFVGGKEIHFDKKYPSFTIEAKYQSPGDYGWIKLYYSEIDELIFYGGIIWLGCGEIEFPTDILKAEDFIYVPTDDYVYPKSFETIFPVDSFTVKYYPNSTIENAWSHIQGLVKTRKYLSFSENVKVFEYQPSAGIGDVADRKWIFFLKK